MKTTNNYPIGIIGILIFLFSIEMNASQKKYDEKIDKTGFPISTNNQLAWIYVDTAIGDYWIRCVAIDNANVNNPEKDDYLDCQIIIDVVYKQNHYRKKLTRYSVERLVPSLDIKANVLVSISLTRITNAGVYFRFNLCIPDSDVCDNFELCITPQGKTKLRSYLDLYDPAFDTEKSTPFFDTIKL